MTVINESRALQLATENVEAFNARDWERMRAGIAPDAVWDEVATERRVHGPDGAIELSQGWSAAFPDARGTVVNAVADGDTAVLELVYEGTHTGALETPQGAVPPSGKRASVRGVMVARVSDGKLVECREYFDVLTLLTQIGAAPQS